MRKLLYKKHKLLGNKGFSLIELIIVIAIMAVLMAVLAPQLIKYVERSRVQADDTFMSELRHTVELACSDDAIYSHLAVAGDTVVWNANTGTITVTLANAGADTAMTNEVTTTIGASHNAQSNTYRNATTPTYTIAISLNAGTVVLTETVPVI